MRLPRDDVPLEVPCKPQIIIQTQVILHQPSCSTPPVAPQPSKNEVAVLKAEVLLPSTSQPPNPRAATPPYTPFTLAGVSHHPEQAIPFHASTPLHRPFFLLGMPPSLGITCLLVSLYPR